MRVKSLCGMLVLIWFAGCAAGVKQITTPDGKQGFYVSCDGSADDWSTCYDAAAKACYGKYAIIDKNETSTPSAYGPVVRRHFIAECKR